MGKQVHGTRIDCVFCSQPSLLIQCRPKQSHGIAVKMIPALSQVQGRWVLSSPQTTTTTACIIMWMLKLHRHEAQDQPASTHSHTGYIFFFCGCPLLWKSQLQTEMALSTFHTEYVALSTASGWLIVFATNTSGAHDMPQFWST